ncbi:hypothetical protein AB0K18_08410 [Nonomuraea sp. NPDC049421]|uniref:hypothetical protein n=1 Tax=Nonomuraea sp. NPDC049421 TaxID=3155275 RepID=UPI00342AB763
MDEGHDTRMHIGDLVRAAVPDASRVTVRRAQLGASGVTTVLGDGRPCEVDGEVDGLDESLERLRELSYRKGKGTWFSCELEFTSGSRGHGCRADGEAMPFALVEPAAALGELTMFPRDVPPEWLLAALPTAMPFGLPVPLLDERPWHSPFDEHRPAPPITGEVSYTPAAGMTARVAGHEEDSEPVPGQRLLWLGERPDDPDAEAVVLTVHEETYYLARHPEGATDGGLRSLTLDGATLRVELTPRAADRLRTETVFEVRLDLPAESMATVRAAVPGMLGRLTDGPQLLGF